VFFPELGADLRFFVAFFCHSCDLPVGSVWFGAKWSEQQTTAESTRLERYRSPLGL
jgi:hypothetical protein